MSQSLPERVIRRGRLLGEIQLTEEEKATHKAKQEAFYQRCWAIFEQLKPKLLNQYYGWYIAIEPDSGDYIIDPDQEAASQKMRQQYPNVIHHIFGINETGVSGKI